LDHPEYCGGIDEIAKSIYFEHKELNIGKIIVNAEKMRNKTIIKRLGYLLERFGFNEYNYLFENIELSEGYTKLDPKLPQSSTYNGRWRLMLNAEINPEMWMG
jgi:predicted transcriptional regulator of viral defense system